MPSMLGSSALVGFPGASGSSELAMPFPSGVIATAGDGAAPGPGRNAAARIGPPGKRRTAASAPPTIAPAPAPITWLKGGSPLGLGGRDERRGAARFDAGGHGLGLLTPDGRAGRRPSCVPATLFSRPHSP